MLRLANLSREDFYLLLTRLRHVAAAGDPAAYLVPDQGLTAFMTHCSQRVGDAYFRTPRNTIKEFVNLLAVLEQNPGTDWASLVGGVDIAAESNPDLMPFPDEELAYSSYAAPPRGRTPLPATGTSPSGQPVPGDGGDDDLATFRL